MMSIIKLFSVFFVLCFVLLSSLTSGVSLPDQAFCADAVCSKPIAEGLTLAHALRSDEFMLTIQRNKQVQVLSRSPDGHFLGVSYQGQYGFVSSIHVREIKVKVKTGELIKIPIATIPWHVAKLAKPASVAKPTNQIINETNNDSVETIAAANGVENKTGDIEPTNSPDNNSEQPLSSKNDLSAGDIPPIDQPQDVIAEPVPTESSEYVSTESTKTAPTISTESTPTISTESTPTVSTESAPTESSLPTTNTLENKTIETFEDNLTAFKNIAEPILAEASEVEKSDTVSETAAIQLDEEPKEPTQDMLYAQHITNSDSSEKIIETAAKTDNSQANTNTVETKSQVDDHNKFEHSNEALNETVHTDDLHQSESMSPTNNTNNNIIDDENPKTSNETTTEINADTGRSQENIETQTRYNNNAVLEEETIPVDVKLNSENLTNFDHAPLLTTESSVLNRHDEDEEDENEDENEKEIEISDNASEETNSEENLIETPKEVVANYDQIQQNQPTPEPATKPYDPYLMINSIQNAVNDAPQAETFGVNEPKVVVNNYADTENVYQQPPSYPYEQMQHPSDQPLQYNSDTSSQYPPQQDPINEPNLHNTSFFQDQENESVLTDSPPSIYQTSDGVGSIEEVTTAPIDVAVPEEIVPTQDNIEVVGLWDTISNWFGSSNTGGVVYNEDPSAEKEQPSFPIYSDTEQIPIEIGGNEFCDALTNSCTAKIRRSPSSVFAEHSPPVYASPPMEESRPLVSELGLQGVVQLFVDEVTALSILFIYGLITGLIVLLFLLGNRFVNKRLREQSLLSKLNILERKLMTSGKECDLLKSTLLDTKHKLSSIEDNSFGSNEMVISLRNEVSQKNKDCLALHEQISALESELETATEAGLELNKMVSELLNNQTGSDSIISSVEEMQRQLNEQEETTAAINTLLAEKSRENSELQVKLLEVSQKYDTELDEVVKQNEQLIVDLERVQTDLHGLTKRSDDERTQSAASSAAKLLAVSTDLAELRVTYEKTRVANVSNEARVQVLEDLVKELRSGEPIDSKLMDATKQKTNLLALTKEKERLTDQLEGEQDARRLLEDHVKVIGEEMATLRQGFSAAEKDKLEAQTRLEVLSTYFKDKETQLQKELSLKEAQTMKQQGETSSTVERIRGLQTDVQVLRSQNDSLKAEIEAQLAAHKVQMAAAENRAHESWLSARQTQRRYEEAVSEAGALRRKLTSLGDVSGGGQQDTSLPNLQRSMDGGLSAGEAPSPIHMDVSGANQAMLMGVLPPPAFLPPPFMAPPPMLPPPLSFLPPPQAPLLPFMPGQHLPPPPGEMRPPPLGRLMSPPPALHGGRAGSGGGGDYSPDEERYRGGRYSDNDEYDSDDDHHYHRRNHRHYSNRSPYNTETDYSPPRSPEPPSRYGRVERPLSPPSNQPSTNSKNNHRPSSKSSNPPANSKGGLSSGSVESLGSRKSHHGAKV